MIYKIVLKDFLERVQSLLESLNIKFTKENLSVYAHAFIHRSAINEQGDMFKEHNERLEFFGDAVLELAITEALYYRFPKKTEGELTDLRSSLVRGRNLAGIAKKLHFHEYIIMSHGEMQSEGQKNPYILANTLEAFIGAHYIGHNYGETKKFITQHVLCTLDNILQESLHIDEKSTLQEHIQRIFNITPVYKVLEESGPDHEKNFLVGVYAGEKCLGQGSGSSKKKAQTAAATNALPNIICKAQNSLQD